LDIDTLLKTKKHVHFIGIGGAGMCPLAEILHSKGYYVTGSDSNSGDTVDRLTGMGIEVSLRQRPENINGADIIVYTAAILPGNPELEAARSSGIPTFERSKLFGAMTKHYANRICVSGTHGKTTVTAMIAQIMIGAGLSPSAVIGGKLPLTGTNGIDGKGDAMICEACEFAGTFLELSPTLALILNIDRDHIECYGSFENLIEAFASFAALAENKVLYFQPDEYTRQAVRSVPARKRLSFGFDTGCGYSAGNIALERAFASFDLYRRDAKLCRLRLAVPGEHNIQNAVAAAAASLESGATADDCVKALEAFKGAARRFETHGEFGGITVVDDYAHHPRELRVTLQAAKLMNFRRIWAVFQPFTFSRTYTLMNDFADVLQMADRCVLTPIMGSREINTYGVSSGQLAEKIPGCVLIDDFYAVAQYISDNTEAGDLVLTLGCGDIYKAAKKIACMLQAKYA